MGGGDRSILKFLGLCFGFLGLGLFVIFGLLGLQVFTGFICFIWAFRPLGVMGLPILVYFPTLGWKPLPFPLNKMLLLLIKRERAENKFQRLNEFDFKYRVQLPKQFTSMKPLNTPYQS